MAGGSRKYGKKDGDRYEGSKKKFAGKKRKDFEKKRNKQVSAS